MPGTGALTKCKRAERKLVQVLRTSVLAALHIFIQIYMKH
ncbi:hypothetical protein P609_15685 [Comamonas thiooxydans]|nr:hypothetical protein P609_15685 [Comamonas thiooxydans]